MIKLTLTILAALFLHSCSSTDQLSTEEKKGEIYFGQGTTHLMNKEYSEALKNLLKAAELSPKNSEIMNNLGMAYFFKKQYQKSIQSFKKAIQLDPKNSDARNNLASIYFSLGRIEEAEKEYLKVVEDLVYSNQYRISYNLGLIKLKQGLPREAINYFKEAIVNNENYCPAYFQLGKLQLDARQYREAAKQFHMASRGTCYNEPAPWYYQGVALLKMGNDSAAKSKFLEVISRFPSHQYANFSKQRLQTLQNVAPANSNLMNSLADKNKMDSTSEKTIFKGKDSANETTYFTNESKSDKTLSETFSTPQF